MLSRSTPLIKPHQETQNPHDDASQTPVPIRSPLLNTLLNKPTDSLPVAFTLGRGRGYMGDFGGLGPSSSGVAPSVAMLVSPDERWRHLDNSVDAVSFGFVATAIFISMFLVMAIFERFLRPRGTHAPQDLEGGGLVALSAKANNVSPKMSVYTKGVSVLMPGEDIPTFIAHPAPAPAPYPSERISWPLHQHNPFSHSASNST